MYAYTCLYTVRVSIATLGSGAAADGRQGGNRPPNIPVGRASPPPFPPNKIGAMMTECVLHALDVFQNGLLLHVYTRMQILLAPPLYCKLRNAYVYVCGIDT